MTIETTNFKILPDAGRARQLFHSLLLFSFNLCSFSVLFFEVFKLSFLDLKLMGDGTYSYSRGHRWSIETVLFFYNSWKTCTYASSPFQLGLFTGILSALISRSSHLNRYCSISILGKRYAILTVDGSSAAHVGTGLDLLLFIQTTVNKFSTIAMLTCNTSLSSI